jgi:hypothetical protein
VRKHGVERVAKEDNHSNAESQSNRLTKSTHPNAKSSTQNLMIVSTCVTCGMPGDSQEVDYSANPRAKRLASDISVTVQGWVGNHKAGK